VDEEDYKMGVTDAFFDGVIWNDPRGELEAKTRYLNAAELALIREADGEELRIPAYFVIKLLRPLRYRTVRD
jgi:hypothetical protein